MTKNASTISSAVADATSQDIGAGIAATNSAQVTVPIVVGDVLASASGAMFATVAKAIPAILTTGVIPVGIALTAAKPPDEVLYAAMGDRVPAATIGLGAGVATWGIVVNGRVVRRDPPVIGDVIAGVVDTAGNLLVMPFIWAGNGVQAALAPYAVPANPTDCTAALQAAIDATFLLPSSIGKQDAAKKLHLGEGWYKITKPLHVHVSGIHISADDEESTSINARDHIGPAVWMGPYTDLHPMIPNTSGSGGNAAVMGTNSNAFLDHYLEFGKYGCSFQLAGRTSFEVAVMYKRGAVGTNGGGILCSVGGRNSDEPILGAFSLYVTDSLATTPFSVAFNLYTTVGGQHLLSAPANSFTNDGLWHEIVGSWDGTTVRIFIDGVLKASAAVSGAFVQHNWETVQFGGRTLTTSFGRSRITGTADGWCAWIHVSDIARRTAAYTPVTNVKPAFDSHTLFHTTFDNNYGCFVGCTGRPFNNASSLMVMWVPSRYDNYFGTAGGKQQGNTKISDITISSGYGPAIDVDNNNNMLIQRCTLNGTFGICAVNVCYVCTYRDLKIFATPANTSPRAGIMLGEAGYYSNISDVQIIGFATGYGVLTLTETFLGGKGYILGNGVQLYSAGSTLTTAGSWGFSDEGTSVNTHIMLNAVTVANLSGITTVSGTHPVEISVDNSGVGPHGNQTKIIFTGTMFGISSAAPGVVLFRGNSADIVMIMDNCAKFDKLANWFIPASAASAKLIVRPDNSSGRAALTMADTNYTVSREDWVNFFMAISGTLTATRTVTVPAVNTGSRSITNLTSQTLNLIASGGAVTVPLTAGATRIIGSTGTELFALS